jgi:hypothetical protein
MKTDNKRRNFFMSDELYTQLKEFSDSVDMSMSDVLRQVLAKFLAQQRAKKEKK